LFSQSDGRGEPLLSSAHSNTSEVTMPTLTRPVGGATRNPNRDEVQLVQRLLNKHRQPPLWPIAQDGLVGPETTAAIEEFQRRVAKMGGPDGGVDPGGPTWRALVGDGVPSQPITAVVKVAFQHHSKLPTGVTGLPGADIQTTATRYESAVTVSGAVAGS